MNKRILIIGDGGRGKTTFAEKLSKKTGIPFYSVDDFFWKTKFSEPADKQQSVQAIEEVYKRDEWIVEGGSRPLIKTGIEKADIIYLLKFNSIIAQYYVLIRRSMMRDNERWIDLWRMLKHVTYKKYKRGYAGGMPSVKEMIGPFKEKVVILKTREAIRRCVDGY